jgi:AraC-like DNA-binding protein
LSTFYRAFKRRYGLTPGELRKRLSSGALRGNQ